VVDVLVCVNGEILLVHYKDIKKHDDHGDWFLPTTGIRFGEHSRDAAMRILQEKFHNYMDDPALSYIESRTDNASNLWYLIFHHKIELDHLPTITPSPDVKDVRWAKLNDLPTRLSIAHGGPALDVIREILKPAWAGSIQQSK